MLKDCTCSAVISSSWLTNVNKPIKHIKTNEIDKQDFRAFDHLKDKKLTIVSVSSTGFIQTEDMDKRKGHHFHKIQ
jgi:hypothetical protein